MNRKTRKNGRVSALVRDGTCRLHLQRARRIVVEIGQTEGIAPLLARLPRQLGHKPPVARQHRNKAWLAQKTLTTAEVVNSNSGQKG